MSKKSSSSSKKNSSQSSSDRFRNFATVIYPESMPENWLEIIIDFRVPCFLSPLHDKDINPNGEPKKPHYHLMFMFDGKKSIEQIKELYSPISSLEPEIVSSLRGYARYLCHLDNPEKAQYSVEEVKSFCGADYGDVIGLASDRYKCIREMMEFCNSNNIFSFSKLLEYASVLRSDWFRLLCDSCSFVMRTYLQDKYEQSRSLEDANTLQKGKTDFLSDGNHEDYKKSD